jgi:ubiquinone/menaquinone biosynthesis C-methylase UbiE
MPSARPAYLEPYSDAHRRRERGARALLWVGRHDQTVRFEALARLCPMAGQRVLDVGCGPADLLPFLHAHGIRPAHYTGIEAQRWLVQAARRRRFPRCTIVEGDFVRRPELLAQEADVVIFSGSLNLLSFRPFFRSLERAWAATGRWLAFNFLSSPDLAGESYLRWHRQETVLAWARRHTTIVRTATGYEDGDCTVAMRRTGASSR